MSTSRAGGPEPDASPGRRTGTGDAGVESNARLTAMTAAVLLVLLAVEGVTVLRVHSLLWLHVFLGTALVPPILLKIGSTGYRFVRYYLGSPAYRRKGPPPPVLRVLGPLVVVATLLLLGSGIALMFVGVGSRQPWLLLHKASFVIWFAAMVFHVLGHLVETARLAPRDWLESGPCRYYRGALAPMGRRRQRGDRRPARLAVNWEGELLVRAGVFSLTLPLQRFEQPPARNRGAGSGTSITASGRLSLRRLAFSDAVARRNCPFR